MPQLPRVAVLGADLVGAAGLAALVDGGIDAVYLGTPSPAAAALLARRALTDRRPASGTDDGHDGGHDGRGATTGSRPAGNATGEDLPIVSRAVTADGSARGFEISVAGRLVGSWDAVVVTGATAAAMTAVVGAGAPLFGGIFHPRADGIYLVGSPAGVGGSGTAPVGAPGQREADADGAPEADQGDPLAWAQASWIGEYLRGRYLLPTYQAMLDHPGLRRVGLRRRGDAGYLRALARELRAGRARAAAAGYPLPLAAPNPAVALIRD